MSPVATIPIITDDQLADLLAIAKCMTGVGDGYSFPGKLTPGQAILALHARMALAERERALDNDAWRSTLRDVEKNHMYAAQQLRGAASNVVGDQPASMRWLLRHEMVPNDRMDALRAALVTP